jgi:hypothetical protein
LNEEESSASLLLHFAFLLGLLSTLKMEAISARNVSLFQQAAPCYFAEDYSLEEVLNSAKLLFEQVYPFVRSPNNISVEGHRSMQLTS